MRAQAYAEVQLWTPEHAPARRFYEADGLAPRRPPRSGSPTSGCRSWPTSRRCERRCGSTSARSAIPGTRSRCSRSARRSSRAATPSRCRRGGAGEEHAEAAGMTFAAAPEYQVFPTRRAAARARTRRRSHAARETVPSVEALRARRRGLRHPHARAGARRRAVRRAGGDARPARAPVGGARLPAVLARRAAAAHARRARGCGGASTRWSRAGSSRAGASTTTAARGSAWRRCRTSTRGCRARSRSSATLPQLEYPRALAGRGCASSGRCCGSRRASAVAPPPGDGPGRAGRAVDRAGPRARAAARGAGRARATRRCA